MQQQHPQLVSEHTMTSQNNKQALQNDDYNKYIFFYEPTQNASLSDFIKTGSLDNKTFHWLRHHYSRSAHWI